MPPKNDKSKKKGEETEDDEEETKEVENTEPKPETILKGDKTIHTNKITYEKLDSLREKIKGTAKQESFEQVICHLLSLYDSIRRVLVLEDMAIMDYTLNEIDFKLKKMAEAEEQFEEGRTKR